MSSFAAYFEKQGCAVVAKRFREIGRDIEGRNDLAEIEAAIMQLHQAQNVPLLAAAYAKSLAEYKRRFQTWKQD